jgi:hypothetical protein
MAPVTKTEVFLDSDNILISLIQACQSAEEFNNRGPVRSWWRLAARNNVDIFGLQRRR